MQFNLTYITPTMCRYVHKKMSAPYHMAVKVNNSSVIVLEMKISSNFPGLNFMIYT